MYIYWLSNVIFFSTSCRDYQISVVPLTTNAAGRLLSSCEFNKCSKSLHNTDFWAGDYSSIGDDCRWNLAWLYLIAVIAMCITPPDISQSLLQLMYHKWTGYYTGKNMIRNPHPLSNGKIWHVTFNRESLTLYCKPTVFIFVNLQGVRLHRKSFKLSEAVHVKVYSSSDFKQTFI